MGPKVRMRTGERDFSSQSEIWLLPECVSYFGRTCVQVGISPMTTSNTGMTST